MVKDVQGMMRHSRVATTTNVHMQELPESVRATIESIHQELMGSTNHPPTAVVAAAQLGDLTVIRSMRS
jgi:hypothetical protein